MGWVLKDTYEELISYLQIWCERIRKPYIPGESWENEAPHLGPVGWDHVIEAVMVTAFLKNDERNLKKVVRSLATPSGVGSGTGSAELNKYSVGHNLQPGVGEPRAWKLLVSTSFIIWTWRSSPPCPASGWTAYCSRRSTPGSWTSKESDQEHTPPGTAWRRSSGKEPAGSQWLSHHGPSGEIQLQFQALCSTN